MRFLLPLLTVLALAAPAAAQVPPEEPDPSIADGTAQAELDAARERWRERRPRSYAFSVRVACFCPPESRGPDRIVVRRGRPVRPPRHLRRVATVARQFARIQEAIDDGVVRLDAAYGGRGRPLRFAVDRAAMIQDEEVGYAFSRFRPRR